MPKILADLSYFFFAYYLLSNIIYLALLIAALVSTLSHRERLTNRGLDLVSSSPFTPPISIICPARNEEASIITSVEALLDLEYPNLEVIVVNDGSTDSTLELLKNKFHLRAVNLLYFQECRCGTVRGIYTSGNRQGLLVIDKENRKSKADAVNAGLNAATGQYVCVIDADSLIEKDALLRIMSGLRSEADASVVAIGGIVRVLNGCRIEGARIRDIQLPHSSIEILQVIEYLRAFLIGREGWALFKMLPIISGAFGVFRTELVRKIGGFRTNAIGEDLDLVIRMHRRLLEDGSDYSIMFVPDPTCWTEVPNEVRSLARQRARWQKGLLDVLWPNRDMLFRPRYGRLGSLMLPYLWTFELFEPLVELLGYLSIVAAWITGGLQMTSFLEIIFYGIAFATMISVGAVLLEEMTFRRYNRWEHVAKLILFCFLEHFPYRQLNMIWRLHGMLQYIRGDMEWRELKRI
ncbi:MAG TPA: glycosyltransferase family 2 protein [Terriglobales bacterium]|nr:glycosyltransferase family 2 protein [Terriglobales bacterium]